MSRLRPFAILAAATALSACSTVSRIGGALNPFDGGDAPHANRAARRPRLDPRVRTGVDARSRAGCAHDHGAARRWRSPIGASLAAPPTTRRRNPLAPPCLKRAWRANLGAGLQQPRANRSAAGDRRRARSISSTPITACTPSRRTMGARHLDACAAPGTQAATASRVAAASPSLARRVFVTTGFGFVVALDATQRRRGVAHVRRRAVPIGADGCRRSRVRDHQ